MDSWTFTILDTKFKQKHIRKPPQVFIRFSSWSFLQIWFDRTFFIPATIYLINNISLRILFSHIIHTKGLISSHLYQTPWIQYGGKIKGKLKEKVSLCIWKQKWFSGSEKTKESGENLWWSFRENYMKIYWKEVEKLKWKM
jgi:hypothetical protein